VKKVLWVKFGWSDYYRGGPVDGNFGWLNEQIGGDNQGRGHEAYNFMPSPDGTYYCYVPPQVGDSAPSNNNDPNGWTVICLAKNPNQKGIHIVGWYENATLIGRQVTPNPAAVAAGENNSSYCITSKEAFFVPPVFRIRPFSHVSIRRGKYSFLDGPGVEQTKNKQQVLNLLTERMAALANVVVKTPTEDNIPDPEIDAADPLKGFGTAEHRKKVEVAAEKAVIAHFKAKGFNYRRVSQLPCGYDFIFSKGQTTLHVEVKGTSSTVAQFFLTRNEHAIGMMTNPTWFLAMVTSALTEAPRVVTYDKEQLLQQFDVEPYVFLGKFIPKSEG
jgi:hypothetical protein